MSSTVTYIAPSGQHLSLTLPDNSQITSTAAQVRFAGGSYGRGFMIGPRGYHDRALKTVGNGGAESARYTVSGRDLTVARTYSGNMSIATLLGDHHELMTVFGGPPPTKDNLLGLFGVLNVVDSPRGMTVKPTGSTLLDADETVAISVKDFGQIAAPGASGALRALPTTAGTKTTHGEMWKRLIPGADGSHGVEDYMFTVGFASALLEVKPHLENGVTDAQFLAWVNDLDASWAAA